MVRVDRSEEFIRSGKVLITDYGYEEILRLRDHKEKIRNGKSYANV